MDTILVIIHLLQPQRSPMEVCAHATWMRPASTVRRASPRAGSLFRDDELKSILDAVKSGTRDPFGLKERRS